MFIDRYQTMLRPQTFLELSIESLLAAKSSIPGVPDSQSKVFSLFSASIIVARWWCMRHLVKLVELTNSRSRKRAVKHT
jgi:hypothetical protein